ncbi:hypothetical protein KKHLCK_16870 [Candidatus Electrothrix laxa]
MYPSWHQGNSNRAVFPGCYPGLVIYSPVGAKKSSGLRPKLLLRAGPVAICGSHPCSATGHAALMRPRSSLPLPALLNWECKPEAQVVVAPDRRVPVTVRRTHEPGIEVPAATANHAVRARRRTDWIRLRI